jgi:hypothetical protein
VAAAPLYPKNPERVCWGCDKFCPAADLACGNGTIRTMHPVELLGEDWLDASGAAAQPEARQLEPDARVA